MNLLSSSVNASDVKFFCRFDFVIDIAFFIILNISYSCHAYVSPASCYNTQVFRSTGF